MGELGRYIVIEGQDATGKSTQVKLVRAWLAAAGVESMEFHEPEDENLPITSKIREIIKDGFLERDPETNVILFTAARNEIWKKTARPALELGKWVVASRNVYSTYAYQGYGEGVDLDIIECITEKTLGHDYMNPDLAVILSLADEDERKRRLAGRGALSKPDTFESRGPEFQQRVTDGYVKVAESYNIPIVLADRPPAEVAEEICGMIADKGLSPQGV